MTDDAQDGFAVVPPWHMEARRWVAGLKNGELLVMSGLWWEGDGVLEVVVCYVTREGSMHHRMLRMTRGSGSGGRMRTCGVEDGIVYCSCAVKKAYVDQEVVREMGCQVHGIGRAADKVEVFATPEEHQAVMELRASSPTDVDILLKNLRELDEDQHRDAVRDFLGHGMRYRLEQVLEAADGETTVFLRLYSGELHIGTVEIVSGPSKDVDDFLSGRATLEELAKRWENKQPQGWALHPACRAIGGDGAQCAGLKDHAGTHWSPSLGAWDKVISWGGQVRNRGILPRDIT